MSAGWLVAGLAGALALAGTAGLAARLLAGVVLDWSALLSCLGAGFGLGALGDWWVNQVAYLEDRGAETRRKHADAEYREIEAAALAARLESEPEKPAAPVPDDAERAWALALERFFRAGDRLDSFSVNSMAGVVGSDVWGRLTDFYCGPAGRGILRIAPGNVGTVWGHGWGLDRVLQLLALGQLPHPAGPAPEVQPYVQSATQRKAPRKSKTQVPPASEMVVDA